MGLMLQKVLTTPRSNIEQLKAACGFKSGQFDVKFHVGQGWSRLVKFPAKAVQPALALTPRGLACIPPLARLVQSSFQLNNISSFRLCLSQTALRLVALHLSRWLARPLLLLRIVECSGASGTIRVCRSLQLIHDDTTITYMSYPPSTVSDRPSSCDLLPDPTFLFHLHLAVRSRQVIWELLTALS